MTRLNATVALALAAVALPAFAASETTTVMTDARVMVKLRERLEAVSRTA